MRKRLLMILVLGACAMLLAACDKGGTVLVTPTHFATSTPTATPSPSPITKITLSSDNCDITSEYSQESDKTVFTVSIKDNILYTDGKKLDADTAVCALENILRNDIRENAPEKFFTTSFLGKQAFLADISLDKYNVISDEIDKWLEDNNFFMQYDRIIPIDSIPGLLQEKVDETWLESAKKIVDVCRNVYAEYADKGYMGAYTQKDLENDNLAVAFGMAMWGFGYFEKDGKTFYSVREKAFDTANGEYPSLDDMVAEAKYLYLDDLKAYGEEEMTDECNFSVSEYLKFIFCKAYAEQKGSEAQTLAGINKIDELKFTVTVEGKCDSNPFEVFGIEVEENQ